jgi:hypothetical protein
LAATTSVRVAEAVAPEEAATEKVTLYWPGTMVSTLQPATPTSLKKYVLVALLHTTATDRTIPRLLSHLVSQADSSCL